MGQQGQACITCALLCVSLPHTSCNKLDSHAIWVTKASVVVTQRSMEYTVTGSVTSGINGQ